MRRFRQSLDEVRCKEILDRCTSGVLALNGEDGPYAVPLSYVREGGSIFFHCATEGKKLDMIRADKRASFCVIDKDDVVPEKFTTVYRSVIVYGKINIIEDEGEKAKRLFSLGMKYSPGDSEGCRKEVESSISRVMILELIIDTITGKQAKELLDTND